MKVRVFQSGKGDALLLSSQNGRHILIDAGVPETYEDHMTTILNRIRNKGEVLDLVCVSHIDRDHIGGVLSMLDAEMEWRLHEVRANLPAAVRPKRNNPPAIARPPAMQAIWHNAFFETVRDGFIQNMANAGIQEDLEDILRRSSNLIAGAGDQAIKTGDRQVNALRLAGHLQFLGQSVGDAIEVSRRIGIDQLHIDHNQGFNGPFITRETSTGVHPIAEMDVHVLGPSLSELDELVETWNDWLVDKAKYLKRLLKGHEEDAEDLISSSVDDLVDQAQQAAIAFGGNQEVTPPNLASIILLIKDNERSILLTGDADDVSILEGLEAKGFVDGDGICRVDVFKIPHHGADNSYSNELARRVIAKHYVFCGNGKHNNPEPRVLNGYLTTLFDGNDGHPPALADGESVTFWFNSGPAFVPPNDGKLTKYWKEVDRVLGAWSSRLGARLRVKIMEKGDSFLVK